MKSYYDSDHSPIYVEIEYKNTIRKSGPGSWKLNDSLLENEEFVTSLNFFLAYAKEKHRGTEDKKMETGIFCIRFSKRIAKSKKSKELDLLREPENHLNVLLAQNPL